MNVDVEGFIAGQEPGDIDEDWAGDMNAHISIAGPQLARLLGKQMRVLGRALQKTTQAQIRVAIENDRKLLERLRKAAERAASSYANSEWGRDARVDGVEVLPDFFHAAIDPREESAEIDLDIATSGRWLSPRTNPKRTAKAAGLPEDPWRYFTHPPDAVLVPISSLQPIRARPTGIENAHKHMQAAYDGTGKKRSPISVSADGRVLDGNSTYAVAKSSGWSSIPAVITDAGRRNPTMRGGAAMRGTNHLAKGVVLKSMRVDQRLWIQAFPLPKKRGAEPVGHVSIERKDEVQDYGCRRDVTGLRRSVRRTLDAPYLVSGSFVHPQWRGSHLGAALYWAAAMTAAGEDPGSFIMAGACDLDETSTEALRVWKSSALRRSLVVKGRVATPATLPKHPFKAATLTFDEDGFLDFPPDGTRSNPEEYETVKIGGVVYKLTEHYLPGSARRSQGGPVLNLVAPDGSVAGSITLRRGRRGFAAIRKGIAKELSPFTALKLYEGLPNKNPSAGPKSRKSSSNRRAQKNPRIRNASRLLTRADYPAVFGDTDSDKIPDVDDPRPLIPGDRKSIEEVRLSDEIGALIDARDNYVPAMDDVMERLRSLKIPGAKVQGRVKTPYSLINKLRRKRLGTLTDVAGTRIVVPDKAALDKVVRMLEHDFEILEKEDFYRTPQAGYRAIHFIVKADGYPVEVQIKTRRMAEISGASHTAYKRGDLDADAMDQLTALADRADSGDKRAAQEIDPILRDPQALRRRLAKEINPRVKRLANRMANGGS